MNLSESDIEESILIYLDSIPNTIVRKIAPSGYLIKDRRGTRMIQHKSPFTRRKMLDIFFLYRGLYFELEVKTEKEFIYINKHWNKLKKEYLTSKGKRKHYAQQIFTIENINRCGGVSMFVYSVEQVKNLIKSVRRINARGNLKKV